MFGKTHSQHNQGTVDTDTVCRVLGHAGHAGSLRQRALRPPLSKTSMHTKPTSTRCGWSFGTRSFDILCNVPHRLCWKILPFQLPTVPVRPRQLFTAASFAWLRKVTHQNQNTNRDSSLNTQDGNQMDVTNKFSVNHGPQLNVVQRSSRRRRALAADRTAVATPRGDAPLQMVLLQTGAKRRGAKRGGQRLRKSVLPNFH